MPRFWYATDETEGRREHIVADSLPQALLMLEDKGLKVTAGGREEPTAQPRGRINEQLLTALYEQLASLLDQGLELSAALQRIAAEATDRRLAYCLTLLAQRISEGYSLSEAMSEQPQVFASLVVNTVAAAEESGHLAEGLRSLSSHQRDLQHLGSDLALPLAYPVVILFLVSMVALTVVIFTGSFIMPKLAALFGELGLEQEEWPWITAVVYRVGSYFLSILFPVLLALGALAIFYLVQAYSRAGRLERRPLGLPVPLFGRLAKYGALSRATGALRLMLKHGLPLGRALRLAGEASGNRHVSLALRRAEHAVNEGGRLAEGLRESGLLPDTFVFTLASAEATGDLLGTLEHLEIDYRRRVNSLARHWVTLAGPVMVVILGLIVGVLAAAMFSPLIRIMQGLTG